MVTSTREGNLYAWRTLGHADQKLQWQSIHHDPQNTSNFGTPIPTQAGPPDEVYAGCGGCTCDTTPGAAVAGALGALSLVVARRRRR